MDLAFDHDLDLDDARERTFRPAQGARAHRHARGRLQRPSTAAPATRARRHRHRDAGPVRPLPDGEGRRPVGPVRRRDREPRHRSTTTSTYIRDLINLDLVGCFAMTETGHGSDVQNLETTATFDPGTEEFVIHSPTPGSRKDYIGNAGHARHRGGGLRAARHPRRDLRRALLPRADPRRAWRGPARRHHVRLRPQGRPRRRRQRAHHVRRGAHPAAEPAQPLRPGRRGRRLLLHHRRHRPPVLHDARHPRPRPGERRRRSRARRPRWPSPSPAGTPCKRRQFGPNPRPRSCSPTTGCTSVACCPSSPAPTRYRFAQNQLVARMHRLQITDEPDPQQQRELESRAAGLKVVADVARVAGHPGGARDVRRRRLHGREPAHHHARRRRRLHHVRGRQPRAAPAGRQGAAHLVRVRDRRTRPDRAGAVRRRHGHRRRQGAHRRVTADPAAHRRPARRRRPSTTCSTAAPS